MIVPARVVFARSAFGPSMAGASAALGQELPDVGQLTGEIRGLIDRLPEDLLGVYQAKLDECDRLLAAGGVTGLFTGGRCLYRLFQELKDVVREEEERRAVPISVRPPAAPPEFPYVPVAIAAAGALVLLYVATR
jgi:hypothetical protein